MAIKHNSWQCKEPGRNLEPRSNISAFLGRSVREFTDTTRGCPTHNSSNGDTSAWVTLCVFSVMVMKSELVALWAGRRNAVAMLRASAGLTEEMILGYKIFIQQTTGSGLGCSLWWLGRFKQSFLGSGCFLHQSFFFILASDFGDCQWHSGS